MRRIRGGVHIAHGGHLSLFALCVAAMAVPPQGAVGQELEMLGEPIVRLTEGFTSITAVTELPGEKILFTDSREVAIVVVDLNTGDTRRIGRVGEGPGEFQSVFSILQMHDGTYWIRDARQRRFTSVSADGEILGTETVAPPMSSMSTPQGLDVAGHAYFDARVVTERGLVRESTVYRWSMTTGAVEPAMEIANYAPGQEGSGFVPMPTEDAWTVSPDGSLARIFAEDFHVEWTGGTAGDAVGAPTPFRRIDVGAAERDRWTALAYSRPGGQMSFQAGTDINDAAEVRGATERRGLDPRRFPDVVPPFQGGYVPSSPDGDIWVKVNVESDNTRTVFNVFDRSSTRVRRVQAAPRSRVVGFGAEVVFIVQSDDFDLEWLSAHRR